MFKNNIIINLRTAALTCYIKNNKLMLKITF
jgi:hypothetical protein